MGLWILWLRKTTSELIRISAAVMGIEFSYAAETAFVSPTLLKIGINHKQMTLIWALSPLFGFFLTPVLGSLSDRCQLDVGRRRPFIFLLSLGVLFGLILVPNGERLGYVLGDKIFLNISAYSNRDSNYNTGTEYSANLTERNTTPFHFHRWGALLTIIGTVLLDFNADACQSPARAFLLDVTLPEDHARGLSTFTIMAGIGGFIGYALGGINWDETILGGLLGGHLRAVFTCVTILFIICIFCTITSFQEVPLHILELNKDTNNIFNAESEIILNSNEYGTMETDNIASTTKYAPLVNEAESGFMKRETSNFNMPISLYLKSLIYMPYSIKILCVTNLFCWMSHVCYSLYFTDFVGEAVFQGNPMCQTSICWRAPNIFHRNVLNGNY